ncbi:hypothetical protein HDU85_004425 [Gaertneriomyces sp. JEL0708]|nr:hypothetical protein HDU85_004425 [Gaertneriomyces sp. JEL0708]
MATDISHFVRQQKLGKVNLIGHSMGGKTAMHYALSHPELVDNLIVVDMAPTDQNLNEEFRQYINAMQKVADSGVTLQSEADRILSETIPQASVRQFLLTNLKKVPNERHLQWRVNLSALSAHLASLWRFPYTGSGRQYHGPALFIAGERGNYITPPTHATIREFFPNATIVGLDCGHWVHAEKPKEFLDLVSDFLTPST